MHSFSNPAQVSAKVTMNSPIGSSVEVRQDHGFNSSIATRVTKAKDSKFTIRQVKSQMNCITNFMALFKYSFETKIISQFFQCS